MISLKTVNLLFWPSFYTDALAIHISWHFRWFGNMLIEKLSNMFQYLLVLQRRQFGWDGCSVVVFYERDNSLCNLDKLGGRSWRAPLGRFLLASKQITQISSNPRFVSTLQTKQISNSDFRALELVWKLTNFWQVIRCSCWLKQFVLHQHIYLPNSLGAWEKFVISK